MPLQYMFTPETLSSNKIKTIAVLQLIDNENITMFEVKHTNCL